MRQADLPEIEQVLAAETKLFDLRRSARAGQKSQLQERINQANEEIVGFSAQKEAKEKEVAFINHELTGVRDLFQKNLVPITRLSQLEREATRLGGERGQLIASMAQAKGKDRRASAANPSSRSGSFERSCERAAGDRRKDR